MDTSRWARLGPHARRGYHGRVLQNGGDDRLRDLSRRASAGDEAAFAEFSEAASDAGLLAAVARRVADIVGKCTEELRESGWPAPAMPLSDFRTFVRRAVYGYMRPEPGLRPDVWWDFATPTLANATTARACPVGLIVIEETPGGRLATLGMALGWRPEEHREAAPGVRYRGWPEPSWAWPELGLWSGPGLAPADEIAPRVSRWAASGATDRMREGLVLLRAWSEGA